MRVCMRPSCTHNVCMVNSNSPLKLLLPPFYITSSRKAQTTVLRPGTHYFIWVEASEAYTRGPSFPSRARPHLTLSSISPAYLSQEHRGTQTAATPEECQLHCCGWCSYRWIHRPPCHCSIALRAPGVIYSLAGLHSGCCTHTMPARSRSSPTGTWCNSQEVNSAWDHRLIL